jgi:large subunit ribosomal protein L23
MALLDFLKRKSSFVKATEDKKVKKPEKKTEAVKLDEKPVEKISKNIKTKGFSYEIVKKPHISEKGSILSEKDNQYVFEVLDGVNKTEIKKSVEGIYGVEVLSVNTIKIPAKKRRIGRTQGFRKGYVKAIVKIKQGQKIEIL